MDSNDVSRRSLLGSIGGAAALGQAGSRAAIALQARPPRLRLGFIGVGVRGQRDLAAALSRQDVEVVGLCDVYKVNIEAAKKMAPAAKVYADFRDMIAAKDIDAICIATPDHWHAYMAVEACKAGKDVYVEKPTGVTIAEGQMMVAAARKYNRVVQVGTQQRSGPHYKKVADIVRSGRLGKVSFVRSWNYTNTSPLGIGNPPDSEPPAELDWDMWLGPAPKRAFNRNRWGVNPQTFPHFRWFWDYAGGMMTDLGVHSLDIVLWAMQAAGPMAVNTFGGNYVLKDNREAPDTFMATFEFPDFICDYEYRDANAQLQGRSLAEERYGITFHGTEGTLFVDRTRWELIPQKKYVGGAGGYFQRGLDVVDRMAAEAGTAANADQTDAHWADFIRCVGTRERPVSDIEEGHRSTTIALLGNISLRSRQRVDWDPEDGDHGQQRGAALPAAGVSQSVEADALITRRQLVRHGLSVAGVGFAARGAPQDELTRLSIRQVSAMLRAKKLSPMELTQACLRRIEKLNPVLNAFITVTGDAALLQARAAEGEIQRGQWRGPLHGVPIALKDLIDTAGIRTTSASRLHANRIPDRDAEVTRRLKAAGAILLGKLNMDEFALGSTSENSQFGAVHNPWSVKHVPGGSSSGAGAAVAAGLCYAALGSDTGGSIREPSSFCGVTGLKPTYALVSVAGVIPLSWTLDHVGPICRCAWDTAAVLGAIAGHDPADPASLNVAPRDYIGSLAMRVSALRLGAPRPFFFEGLDPEVEAAVREALRTLGKLTSGVRDVTLPLLPNVPLVPAEAHAFHQETFARDPGIYNPALRRVLETGSTVTSANYIRARREVDRLRHSISQVFDTVDLLITPTVPMLPPLLGAERPPDSPALRNTRPFNHNGLPAISVRCGFSRQGLPIGLQIAGRRLDEARVLALAHAFEPAAGEPGKIPDL